MDEFAKGLCSGPDQASSARRPGQGPLPDPTLLEQFPWLHGHFSSRATSKSTAAKSSAERALLVDAKPDMDDEIVEQAYAELEQKRKRWAGEAAVAMPDFLTKIRGGAWTLSHTGVAADSVRGETRGEQAVAWRSLHGLPKSATFSLGRDTEATAGVLVREWCRRMQFFFDLTRDSGRAGLAGGLKHLAVPPEPQEVVDLVAKAAAGSPIRERAEAIRALRPKAL